MSDDVMNSELQEQEDAQDAAMATDAFELADDEAQEAVVDEEAAEAAAPDSADEEVYPSDKICDLIDCVIEGLVDHPDDLELAVTDNEGSTYIEIHAHPDDLGKIIGSRGHTIKAIRTLARALGSKVLLRVDIEVVG